MNDEKMQLRAIDKNALPVIFSVKISGGSATEAMHQMAVYAKTQFEKRKIKLLVNEIQAKEHLVEYHNYLKLESFEQAQLLAPYANCSKLITESINLEKNYVGGFIKLTEMAGRRKDRTYSLLYALYYTRMLETELRKNTQKQDYSKLFANNKGSNTKTNMFGSKQQNPFGGTKKLFGR